MSGADDEVARRQEAAAVDRYVRHHFAVDIPDTAHVRSGSESDARNREPDEDEQFAAYMRQHFPMAQEG